MAQSESSTTIVLAWTDESFSEPALRFQLARARRSYNSCFPEGLATLKVLLTLNAGDIALHTLCFGFDLERFAAQIEELHHTFDGEASFCNAEGSIHIKMVMAKQSRGRLALGGKIEFLHFPEPALLCVGFRDKPGGDLVFDGLITEQSRLPDLIRDIRRFVQDEGISTMNPMLVNYTEEERKKLR